MEYQIKDKNKLFGKFVINVSKYFVYQDKIGWNIQWYLTIITWVVP